MRRYTGGSVICDVTGYLLAEAAIEPAGRASAPTSSPRCADDKRLGPHNDAFDDLRPELYHPTRK